MSQPISNGRLTSGYKPVHLRRVPLANAIFDGRATLMTMLANWPLEYEIPADHDIHQLLEIMRVIAEDLTNAEETDQVV